MKTILFQGDSITDCRRYKDEPENLGQGYVNLCAAMLGKKYPQAYGLINRGISGNKITDLLPRWKRDCINLKPDLLSLLIGVNDVWHELAENDGTDCATFEAVYDILLANTIKALPDTKILLMEPFVLDAPYTLQYGGKFHQMVEANRQAVGRLAKKYNLPLLPTQAILNKMVTLAPGNYWTREGVHPTPAGHQVIAEAWIAFAEKEGLLP